MTTNTMLRDLKPDTEYKVTLVPVYPDAEGKHVSENGKTSEFGQSLAAGKYSLKILTFAA